MQKFEFDSINLACQNQQLFQYDLNTGLMMQNYKSLEFAKFMTATAAYCSVIKPSLMALKHDACQ
jgi:hypothetical protein